MKHFVLAARHSTSEEADGGMKHTSNSRHNPCIRVRHSADLERGRRELPEAQCGVYVDVGDGALVLGGVYETEVVGARAVGAEVGGEDGVG